MWEGADGLRCELPLGELEPARPGGLALPAGPARIVALAGEGGDARAAPVVLELELAPGESREPLLE